MTYNFDLCKACIILKENQEFSDNSEQKTVFSVPSLAENEFSAKARSKGAGEVFAKAETEPSGLCDEQVKLERAQGECLGIRSRRRT